MNPAACCDHGIKPCTQASAITEKLCFYFIQPIRFNYDLICVLTSSVAMTTETLSITIVSLPLQMWLRVVVLHEDCSFYTLLSIFFCSDNDFCIEE